MGFFPARASRRPAIGSTPSSGETELLRALRRIDLRRRGATYDQVARALKVRQPNGADVGTALDAISATYVTKSGSGASATYTLTRTGLKHAKSARARAVFPYPYL